LENKNHWNEYHHFIQMVKPSQNFLSKSFWGFSIQKNIG